MILDAFKHSALNNDTPGIEIVPSKKNRKISKIIGYAVKILLFPNVIFKMITFVVKEAVCYVWYDIKGKDIFEGHVLTEVPVKTPKPWLIYIENTTDEKKKAVIMGNNRFLLTPNHGSDEGIKIEAASKNTSYLQMLQQSNASPFDTAMIRVRSENKEQVTQKIEAVCEDCSGQAFHDPIHTESYISAYQFQDTIVDIPYQMRVDGNTHILIEVLPKTKFSMVFFPKPKEKKVESKQLKRVLSFSGIIRKYPRISNVVKWVVSAAAWTVLTCLIF